MAKKYFFRCLTIAIGCGLFSCTSSKLNYHQAYKFSQYKYQNDQPSGKKLQNQANEAVALIASIDPDFNPTLYSNPKLSLEKVALALADNATVTSKPLSRKLKREKKKAFRKDIKEKVKTFLKERKEFRKQNKKSGKAMNRKVYTGLIIAGAGLVVAILASGTIGALAIIVGIALIAWGLIEEGT